MAQTALPPVQPVAPSGPVAPQDALSADAPEASKTGGPSPPGAASRTLAISRPRKMCGGSMPER